MRELLQEYYFSGIFIPGIIFRSQLFQEEKFPRNFFQEEKFPRNFFSGKKIPDFLRNVIPGQEFRFLDFFADFYTKKRG